MTELLDITTVVQRDTVNIRTKKNPAGKLYELLNIDELGSFEHQAIVNCHGIVQTLSQLKKKPTAAQERQLSKALGDILKLIIPTLEPRVLAEIEDTQRAKIVTAWSIKHATDDGAAEGEDGQASASTTGDSSPASKRSTAATRRRGSTSRATR